MLSPVVAIPYDDALLDLIDQGCDAYIESIGDKYSSISDLAYSFLSKQTDDDLLQSIEKVLEENGRDFQLPEYIVSILAGYAMNNVIDGEEDEERKSILSTIVMNEMLGIRGRKDIAYPEILESLFEHHIYKYLCGSDGIEMYQPTDIIQEAYDEELDYSKLTDEKKSDAMMVFKEATLLRCMNRLQDPSIKHITNVYARIYNGLIKLIKEMEVLSYNFSPKDFINKLIFDGEEKVKKSVSSIVAAIKSSGFTHYELSSNSSLIMGLLENSFDLDTYGSLFKVRLSPMQFGIYIYYELYIEEYIRRNNNGGEK